MEVGEVTGAISPPKSSPEIQQTPTTPEVKTFESAINTLKTEHPAVFEWARNRGDLQSWGGVIIGAKPAETAPVEYNRWFFQYIKDVNPEIASRFALLEPALAKDTDLNPSRNYESWFVNKGKVVEAVNANLDFFESNRPAADYEQAEKMLSEKLADPDKADTTYGLLYGYPRSDCEAWDTLKPVISALGGFRPNAKEHLTDLGFSGKESAFILKFAFDGPFFLRKIAVHLMAKHIPASKEQQDLLLSRVHWKDKYNTLAWVGVKRNKNEAVAKIKETERLIRQTGLDQVLNKI